jgi:hypothetical protein
VHNGGAYGDETTIPCAFHSNLGFLAQSGGDLVQSHPTTSHSPGDVQQRQGIGRENRSLRPEFQPSSPGTPQRIRSSLKSSDYANVLTGQHSSRNFSVSSGGRNESTQHLLEVYSLESESLRFFSGVDLSAALPCPDPTGYSRTALPRHGTF